MVCAIQSRRGLCWPCSCLRTQCKFLVSWVFSVLFVICSLFSPFQVIFQILSRRFWAKIFFFFPLGFVFPTYFLFSLNLPDDYPTLVRIAKSIGAYWFDLFLICRFSPSLQHRISNIAYNITNAKCTPVSDQSAPVYITIGDGGNIEGLANK